MHFCVWKSSSTRCLSGLKVGTAMAEYFCLPSTSCSFYQTHKGLWAGTQKRAHTHTEQHTHTATHTQIQIAPTAFLFVSNFGGLYKSHSSFQALCLSGLLETTGAQREFKHSHWGQLAFSHQKVSLEEYPLLTTLPLPIYKRLARCCFAPQLGVFLKDK